MEIKIRNHNPVVVEQLDKTAAKLEAKLKNGSYKIPFDSFIKNVFSSKPRDCLKLVEKEFKELDSIISEGNLNSDESDDVALALTELVGICSLLQSTVISSKTKKHIQTLQSQISSLKDGVSNAKPIESNKDNPSQDETFPELDLSLKQKSGPEEKESAENYFNFAKSEENPKTQFDLYKKSADLGNVKAMYNLGVFYAKGIGTAVDEKKAFEQYRKAANLNDPKAKCNLGLCYELGRGVSPDPTRAVQLYKEAARLGNTQAKLNLAACYERGIGTEVDIEKAKKIRQDAEKSKSEKNPTKQFELYKKSADLGDVKAMYNLGVFYAKGIGTSVDLKKAFEQYEKAANLNDPKAKCNLGLCYELGRGVSPDAKRAVQLYKEAAKLGNTQAKLNLANCYEKGIGTDVDIEKAKKIRLDVERSKEN